jgi:hypothetical protein
MNMGMYCGKLNKMKWSGLLASAGKKAGIDFDDGIAIVPYTKLASLIWFLGEEINNHKINFEQDQAWFSIAQHASASNKLAELFEFASRQTPENDQRELVFC